MLVARFGCRFDAGREYASRFLRARFASQELTVHEVAWNVSGVVFEETAKVLVRGGGVSAAHAFDRQAVAREGVVRLLRHELLEHLAAGFLLGWRLLGHRSRGLFGYLNVSYYTGTQKISQAPREKKVCMRRKRGETERTGSGLAGKPVSASRSEMTEIVLPAQTNPLGKLLGGHVMHLVDMAAAMAAHRHSGSYVVTASVDYIDFRNPVSLGEIVILKSQVNRVFHTSLEVGVEVYSENVLTGEKKHTTTAYVTFVAIDEHTRLPKPVPPLIVSTEEEKKRFREAGRRREVRLALRYGGK